MSGGGTGNNAPTNLVFYNSPPGSGGVQQSLQMAVSAVPAAVINRPTASSPNSLVTSSPVATATPTTVSSTLTIGNVRSLSVGKKTNTAAAGSAASPLPRILTKRSNKKMAEDNPFFLVEVVTPGGDLKGSCRLCDEQYMFEDFAAMERHYEVIHSVAIEIKRFKLFYEISHHLEAKRWGRAKFFICLFCGKEFTTKFNVRRHQMLYCPRKGEIDPRDLGLHGGQVAAPGGEAEAAGGSSNANLEIVEAILP